MTNIGDYVMQNRYNRPLFLAGRQTSSAHLVRRETFLNRWRQVRGTTPNFTSVGIYDRELAFQHVSEYLAWFDSANRPDILVCENDALAMGAIDAIRCEFGLRIPEDIAVTSFDDVPQAANPHYRPTTFRQPFSAMAEGLVQVLKGDSGTMGLKHFAFNLRHIRRP